MTKTLAKNFHLCFRPQHHLTTPKHTLNNHDRHHDRDHQCCPLLPQNTPYTKTYNSLYEHISCFPLITTTTASMPSSMSGTNTDTDMVEAVDDDSATPDLTAAYASRRFFISSPGRSNSIIDSLSSSSVTTSSPEDEAGPPPPAVVGGVAVETYSPDPYADFRRSMEEMVVALGVAREDEKGAWEYLQELLLSYLALNPKSIHKYIVRAFGDVVAGSMSPIINTNNDVCLLNIRNSNNSNNNNNNSGASSSSSSQSFSSYCSAHCNDFNDVSYVRQF